MYVTFPFEYFTKMRGESYITVVERQTLANGLYLATQGKITGVLFLSLRPYTCTTFKLLEDYMLLKSIGYDFYVLLVPYKPYIDGNAAYVLVATTCRPILSKEAHETIAYNFHSNN